jgi:hypothetical protein
MSRKASAEVEPSSRGTVTMKMQAPLKSAARTYLLGSASPRRSIHQRQAAQAEKNNGPHSGR